MRHIKGQATHDSQAPVCNHDFICSHTDCCDCNLATLYGKCTIGIEHKSKGDNMRSSEEIKRVHAEIKSFLPPAAFVIVEHSYRNYEIEGVSEEANEAWNCQAYANSDNPLDCMFHANGCKTGDGLVEKAKEAYAAYQPDNTAKIAVLEKQLAKLRGES